MKTLGVWTLLVAAACLCCSFVHGIVGGHDTNIENFPYQVSVLVDNVHRCGGSILSQEWILTSASCIKKWKDGRLTVRAGSSRTDRGGTLHGVNSSALHDKYDSKGKARLYNIAVLQLKDKLVLSDSVMKVRLAPVGQDPAASQKLTLTGWGRVDDSTEYASILQAVRFPILSRRVCKLVYANEVFTSDMLCAGVAGKDFCKHDGGAPLMMEDSNGLVQVGLASFAVGSECGAPGLPSAFTNIADEEIRSWITRTTEV